MTEICPHCGQRVAIDRQTGRFFEHFPKQRNVFGSPPVKLCLGVPCGRERRPQ